MKLVMGVVPHSPEQLSRIRKSTEGNHMCVPLRCCGYQSTDHITGLFLRMGNMLGVLKMKMRNMTDKC